MKRSEAAALNSSTISLDDEDTIALAAAASVKSSKNEVIRGLSSEEIDIVEKSYSEAEQSLIKFVDKQIDLMNQAMVFHGDLTPSFDKINYALMNYESVISGLLILHQKARIRSELNEERYNDFFAEKFVEVKREQQSLGKQGFSSAREIEYIVRQRFMKELAKLKADQIESENEYNLMNHLLDAWKSYQWVLSTLSKNAQTEAGAAAVSYSNPKEFGDEQMDQSFNG